MRKKFVIAGLVFVPLVVAALVYAGSLVKDRATADTRPNADPPVPPAVDERKGDVSTLDPAREVVFLAPGFT